MSNLPSGYNEPESLDDHLNRLYQHIEICEKALLDILDGCDEYELRAFTGLSLERCRDICDMRNYASSNKIP